MKSELFNIVWPMIRNSIFVLFSDTSCIYCRDFSSNDMDKIINHCKSCQIMPRPHLFLHKFVCLVCDYYTYASGNIRRHIRNHLGEKPYQCTMCDYTACRSDTLQRHMLKCTHSTK